MANIIEARKELIARILEGDGMASPAQRRAAFDHSAIGEPLNTLIDKVTKHASRGSKGGIGGWKKAGLPTPPGR